MILGQIPHGHPDREKLLRKVIELLPKPKEITDESKAAYERKIERIRNKILAGKRKIRIRTGEVVRRKNKIGIAIVRGNSKIGEIDQFSLPAGQNFRGASCPGATELCESLCYAKSTLFSMHEAQYYVNWAYILLWPERFRKVWGEARLTDVVRIHVGGDFFDPDYVNLWASIIRDRDDIRFYAYTRSWQNGKGRVRREFLGPLRELSGIPNMRLILSCDHETGIPPEDLIPKSIRAWLAVNNEDMPEEPLELIFRDKEGMSGVTMKKAVETTVCPVERSPSFVKKVGAVTCRNCSFCWSSGHRAYDKVDDDLSQFNIFAKVNLPEHTQVMFRGFMPPAEGPSMSGTDQGLTVECICGAEVPCARCGACAFCSCEC